MSVLENKTINPKVSIVIPVYNGSNYLKEAIDCALAQTYKNIEVVVVNDGSNDNDATEAIALLYGSKIKYVKKQNGGIASALNAGIRNMTGEYFSWLSHDDLYSPNKVELEVKAIQNKNDIILCDGKIVDFSRKPIKHHNIKMPGSFNGFELFKNYVKGYRLNGLGFLVPKSVLIDNGMFDESLPYLQDFDMWIRLCWKNYNFICLSDELVVTRIHRMQTTNLLSDRFRVDENAVAQKHFNLLIKENVDSKYFRYYYLLYVRSNCKLGAKLFKKYLKENKMFSLGLRIKSLNYKMRCLIIFCVRKIRNIKYSKKKMRD